MSSIIKRADIRSADVDHATSPPAAMPAPRSRGREVHAKRLEVLRVGDRVHALELSCSCGETSLIELDYPEDSVSGAA